MFKPDAVVISPLLLSVEPLACADVALDGHRCVPLLPVIGRIRAPRILTIVVVVVVLGAPRRPLFVRPLQLGRFYLPKGLLLGRFYLPKGEEHIG